MINTNTLPDVNTRWGRFRVWFHNHVNWCEGTLYDPENPEILLDKPDNSVYNWFYKYWLWPFEQTGCACCNTVRGLIYGAIIGFVLGKFL